MAAQSPSSLSQDGSGGSGSSDNLVFQAPQTMREDYIQNAVKFLGHPKVKGSPVSYRYSFLEKKGLTKEEIDEAFRRVPDPQPNSTDAAAVGSQKASNPNQSAAVQPYTAVQSPQATTGSVTASHIVPHTQTQFSWFHMLLGAGVFLGFGATSVVILKKLFLPRLKSWTRRIVAEGDENANDKLTFKIYDEIKEAIEVSASAVSAIAKTNEELLASKDEDKKILIKLTEALDSQAEVLKSLSEALRHTRENRFSQYNQFEEHVQPAPWNGRHSFMSSPAELTSGSFPRSYVEQRVQRPGYGYQPQMNNDRPNLSMQESYYGSPPYHYGGNTVDAPAPAPAPAAVAEESPFRRPWVPPQPPGVVMPEAAAAIRQPRSIPRQEPQSRDGRQAAAGTDAPISSGSAVNEQMDGGASGFADGSGAIATAGVAENGDGVEAA